ncbi:hypothetical protein HFP72_22780 [Nocardiopsis sp. ARC36]
MTDTLRLVCAGDRFISADLLAGALEAELAGGARRHALPATIDRVDSDWPTAPFSDVDGSGRPQGTPSRWPP